LETVDSLLAKCLLRNINEESEERPLGMFETIRAYGLSCLQDAGELTACQRAYALYYLKVVEQAEPYLKDSQQAAWLGRLEREQKNLRAALGWLVEQKETWLALRFCEVFGKYCGLSGYWTEEKYWLDAVLSLPIDEPRDTAIRARVLRRAGHLAYRLRELANARQLFEQSVMYARAVDDKSTLVGALSGLSWVVYRQKETMLADRLLRESLEIAQQGNDNWSLANILESRGRFLYNQGNNEEARTLLEQSVNMARKLADKENLARILTTLVKLELAQGNMEQARKTAQESYQLAIALKTRPLIALTLDTVGDVAIAEGAYAQAKQYIEERITRAKELGDTATMANRQLKLADIVLALGETRAIKQALDAVEQSLTLLREQEDIPSIIDALSMLADLYQAEGSLLQAQSLYLEALQLYSEFGEERKIGRCLLGLAQICLEQKRVERAAYLYSALAARQKAFTPMHPAQRAAYGQLALQIRAQLSEAGFELARTKGSIATLSTLLASSIEEN
jgi:tetratricopeptide (TPR) repeat protein